VSLYPSLSSLFSLLSSLFIPPSLPLSLPPPPPLRPPPSLPGVWKSFTSWQTWLPLVQNCWLGIPVFRYHCLTDKIHVGRESP
jgi:hypothetical protein